MVSHFWRVKRRVKQRRGEEKKKRKKKKKKRKGMELVSMLCFCVALVWILDFGMDFYGFLWMIGCSISRV